MDYKTVLEQQKTNSGQVRIGGNKMKSRSMAFAALAIFSATVGPAATIQLSGIRAAQDTALVSGVSLSGSVYTFTIENTAPVGVIANLGLSFGNSLRLTSFTTSAPFQYNIQNNTIAPDFNFPLDFAMAGADQTKGLLPGESETYSWVLSMANGMPLAGISAADIAQHQVVRFRLLPTASGTDLAIGPAITPEAPTLSMISLALLGLATRKEAKRYLSSRLNVSPSILRPELANLDSSREATRRKVVQLSYNPSELAFTSNTSINLES